MEWILNINNHLYNFLLGLNLSPKISKDILESIYVLFAFLGYIIVDKTVIKFVRQYVNKFAAKSKTDIDDILFKNKVFTYFLHIITIYILLLVINKIVVDFVFLNFTLGVVLKLIMDYYMIRGLIATFNAINDIYNSHQQNHKKSIKSYIQVFQLLAIVIGALVAVSIVVSKDISYLLTGIGAFAAVLMLIFKDTILGFVGGIQINANNMLEIGDWISVPDAGADGVVIDISLTTVKVQNWDKTISTIPTYSLVSNTFHNWRGMEESGGRRIKRHVNIDLASIKFLTDDEINRLKDIKLLSDYLNSKEQELQEYNLKMGIKGEFTNGRHLTNVGVFRAYIEFYLKANKDIHANMTFLVRQLQATEKGLPLEIYVFSKRQEWAEYEAIQADIFDHIFAIIPEFDLRIFQNPSGADFKSLGH